MQESRHYPLLKINALVHDGYDQPRLRTSWTAGVRDFRGDGEGRIPATTMVGSFRCRPVPSPSRDIVLLFPFPEPRVRIGIGRRCIELDHTAQGVSSVPGCAVQPLVGLAGDEIDDFLFRDLEVLQQLRKRHGIGVGIEFLRQRAELVPFVSRFRKIDRLSFRVLLDPLQHKVIPAEEIADQIVDAHHRSFGMSLKGRFAGFRGGTISRSLARRS